MVWQPPTNKEEDINELIKNIIQTRHENFHGKFSLCAENLIRSIGHKLKCKLKVFTDYPVGHI